jgi:hypothetical protein
VWHLLESEKHIFLVDRVADSFNESVEVLFILEEVQLVGVDDEGFSEIIASVPVVVIIVQASQVINGNGLFVIATTLLNADRKSVV